jgi:phytanoyl-CoA hydroxylase
MKRSLSSVAGRLSKNGFAVIPDAVPLSSVLELRGYASSLADAERRRLSLQNDNNDSLQLSIFSTGHDQASTADSYFLNSGDKMCYFFEEEKDGDDAAAVPAVNKLGHAMHDVDSIFSSFARQRAFRDAANQIKTIDTPLLLQSMYIFKQPRVGGVVAPHQDSTFLYTEPMSCHGLWLAIDDATEENGCMWALPGSHRTPVRRRFVRDPSAPDSRVLFDPPMSESDEAPDAYGPLDDYVPLPVRRGTMIILHGQLVHFSHPNRSDKPRHAFTLHVIDANARYAANNWLQRPDHLPLRSFD